MDRGEAERGRRVATMSDVSHPVQTLDHTSIYYLYTLYIHRDYDDMIIYIYISIYERHMRYIYMKDGDDMRNERCPVNVTDRTMQFVSV